VSKQTQEDAKKDVLLRLADLESARRYHLYASQRLRDVGLLELADKSEMLSLDLEHTCYVFRAWAVRQGILDA